MFPAGSADGATCPYPNNPRCWFDDPTIDVTTPAGLANFENRLLGYATTSVPIMKKYNAQGVIIWDIEGVAPFAYVGDPAAATALAPELTYDDVIDKFFNVFTSAGIPVGVTLRDQDVVFDSNGNPSVVIPPDEAQDYINKITYAQSHWSAKFFYIDSTNPNTITAVLAKVHAAFPNVLLIPEHAHTNAYAYGAPYYDLVGGTDATPADVRALYPNAFSALFIGNGNIPATMGGLTTDVQAGDILLFHGWFDSSEQSSMAQIYAAAGKPLSIGAPLVSNSKLFAAASESGAENGTLAAALILAVIALAVLIIIFISPA